MVLLTLIPIVTIVPTSGWFRWASGWIDWTRMECEFHDFGPKVVEGQQKRLRPILWVFENPTDPDEVLIGVVPVPSKARKRRLH